MMQSVQSPSNSLVFCSLDTLSPPPTPGRNHDASHFPHAMDEFPVFLSSAKSLFKDGTAPNDENESTFEAFSRLASAPLPSIPVRRLKARPIYGTRIIEDQFHTDKDDLLFSARDIQRLTLNKLPPLPFADFPARPKQSVAASSSSSDKLPSFQRGGMAQSKRTANRGKCFTARSA
mmetsp:Transcript_23772/g.47540  ORF Transcript_23772/g.47540 Transcript_23772/m.47540 type:complete len:176 (-) Transcript_23772:118-645(-)